MKHHIRAAALLALTAFALATPIAANAEDKSDTAIVPGKRIGAAAFGMSAEQLQGALGKPASKLHISDGYLLLFGDVRVVLGEDGHVRRVETDSADFKTADGFGVGSMEPAIAAKLGAPAKAQDIKTTADNLQIPLGHRVCYEPGLVFVTEFQPRQPHAVTLVSLREGGCAHAFD